MPLHRSAEAVGVDSGVRVPVSQHDEADQEDDHAANDCAGRAGPA